MAVILSDGLYSVRRRPHEFSRDAHGLPVAPAPGPAAGPWPGCVTETPDGTWSIRLDPAAWRLRPGDLIDAPDGRIFLAESALLHVNNAAPDVDYVSVVASLQPPERD